ncbi:MAG TPA: hypothetical protein HA252_06535 [Candidatus Diapherotrites archaeon]|uniref:Uncharacterized protein n=1 Tax=Candidatus Iainarchaeum sp. TaxID=3101447 RepID=A0A7J4JI76_9ARCH|nr:hypothetical protein [Candidatus Diapherotrites archaeon]HIH17034.1 hypothetical protein [Candidatus Diapherotrites archaeon]
MGNHPDHVVAGLVVGLGYWLVYLSRFDPLLGLVFLASVFLGVANGDGPGQTFNVSPDMDKYLKKNLNVLGPRSWIFHSPIVPIVLLSVKNQFLAETNLSLPIVDAAIWGFVLGYLLHVIQDGEHPEDWEGGAWVGYLSAGLSLAVLVYLFFVNPFWIKGLG